MNGRELLATLEGRIHEVLGVDPSEAAACARAIHVAALDYSARYLRSIMADRAANLLELRAMDIEFDGLELEDREQHTDRTLVGLGVRPVPPSTHSF